jgi:hypothetical protein
MPWTEQNGTEPQDDRKTVELGDGRGAVVLLVPLGRAGRLTAGMPYGSWMVVHMNGSPRGSFLVQPTSVGGASLVRPIRERFGFNEEQTVSLAETIAAVLQQHVKKFTE